jgi:hypothetical protein
VFRNFSIVLCMSLPLVGACAANSVDDELAGESAADNASGKADSTALETFYTVQPDLRKCAAPMCGGYFVSRVNHAKTRCADGVQRNACYVWDFDFSAVGVTGRELDGLYMGMQAQTLVVRGDLSNGLVNGKKVGHFTATEAWQAGAAAGAPDGVWVELEDNGIRCITAPCPSTTEHKLNSVLTANLADLDYSPSGATDDEIQKASDGYARDGLIIVGDRYYTTINGHSAKGRTVTQFYTKVQPTASTGPACIVTGCNGEVCAAEKVITSCEWQDSYACYADATCEKQADGTCGWTDTNELEACLESYL